jgi:hypothetical protein
MWCYSYAVRSYSPLHLIPYIQELLLQQIYEFVRQEGRSANSVISSVQYGCDN